MGTFNEDFPELAHSGTGRESVDRIRHSYASKDAERARAARLRMQEPQERANQNSMQLNWEAQRARRDARVRRDSNRVVIDARGSMDSRAFNEKDELVGYTIDARDRHEPMVDMNESKSRWRSHDGRFDGTNRVTMAGGRTRAAHPTQIGLQGGSMGSRRNFAAANQGGIPLFVKIAVPVIIVLAIVLVVLLTP